MKKVIFFDFFGVISSPAMPPFCKKYGIKKEEYHPLLSKLDNGDIEIDEVMKFLEKRTGILSNSIKLMILNDIKINQDMLSLLAELKKKYRICLLSNASLSFIGLILNYKQLYSYFDKTYISSQLKMTKPHKDIFDYALNDQRINGEDAVFIDDNEDNVLGAKKSGIDGIVFSTYENLIKELKSQKII